MPIFVGKYGIFLNLIVKILLIKQSICVKIGANRENTSNNGGNS